MLITAPKLILPPRRLYGLGVHAFTLYDGDQIVSKNIVKNMIVDVGLNMLGQLLLGLVSSTQGLNYCALGTGSGTIAAGNTHLAVEGARKLRGSGQVSSNVVTAAFYFGPDEANNTWTRYGTFIDGDDDADTGTLFTHVAISITKASGQGLTVTSQYTITSAP